MQLRPLVIIIILSQKKEEKKENQNTFCCWLGVCLSVRLSNCLVVRSEMIYAIRPSHLTNGRPILHELQRLLYLRSSAWACLSFLSLFLCLSVRPFVWPSSTYEYITAALQFSSSLIRSNLNPIYPAGWLSNHFTRACVRASVRVCMHVHKIDLAISFVPKTLKETRTKKRS